MTDEEHIKQIANNDLDMIMDEIALFSKVVADRGLIVEFVGNFVILDPNQDYEVVADRVIGFGLKGTIQMATDIINKFLDEEDDEFINW